MKININRMQRQLSPVNFEAQLLEREPEYVIREDLVEFYGYAQQRLVEEMAV